MKTIFLSFLSIIFLSCSQDTPPQPDPAGTLKYRINGQLVTYNNAGNPDAIMFQKRSSGIYPETLYIFEGHQTSIELFQSMIVTDSLQTINYHYDSIYLSAHFPLSINVDHNNNQVNGTLLYSGDYFDLNITSYSNGFVSGNFTARLSPFINGYDYNTRGTVLITEGEFNNVKLKYY